MSGVCAQESKAYKPSSTNIGFIIKQGGRHVSWEADARNIAYDGMQRRNKRLISISGQKAELTQRPGRADAALRSICGIYLHPSRSSKTDSAAHLDPRHSAFSSMSRRMSDGPFRAFWTCKKQQLANILCLSRTSCSQTGRLLPWPKIIGSLIIPNLQANVFGKVESEK